MVFDLGAAKAKTTLLDFNSYVLSERHKAHGDNGLSRADSTKRGMGYAPAPIDVLLMSFNTFGEIDLLKETAGGGDSKIRRLTQLSYDDNCTVFCAIRTIIEGRKFLSVAAAHKGKLYDISDRTINLGQDDYGTDDKIKIYNSSYGKTAILIDSDATQRFLWKKIKSADFVFCFILDDNLGCEIQKLSVENDIPAIILSPSASVLVKR